MVYSQATARLTLQLILNIFALLTCICLAAAMNLLASTTYRTFSNYREEHLQILMGTLAVVLR